MHKLLKPEEAADLLGLAPNTLAIWRIQGKGPPYHKIGAAVRYDEDDLAAYLAEQRRKSTSEDVAPQ